MSHFTNDEDRTGTDVPRRDNPAVELFVMDAAGSLRPEPDAARWLVWMHRDKNRILIVSEPMPGVFVSTVFLGSNWGGDDSPMYFDTTIIGGPRDGEFMLSASRTDALITHDLVVEFCRANQGAQ